MCPPSCSALLQALPALWSSCGLDPAGSSQSCALSSPSSKQPRCRNSLTDKIPVLLSKSSSHFHCFGFDCKKDMSPCVLMCFFTGGTHVYQTRDEDEGPRRVWPGQLEPDLAYLAEARRHFDRWGAVFGLLHRIKLPTEKHTCNMWDAQTRTGDMFFFWSM